MVCCRSQHLIRLLFLCCIINHYTIHHFEIVLPLTSIEPAAFQNPSCKLIWPNWILIFSIFQKPSNNSTELVCSSLASTITEDSDKPSFPSKFSARDSKHFGETIMEYWANKQQLHKKLCTQLITVIYREVLRYIKEMKDKLYIILQL